MDHTKLQAKEGLKSGLERNIITQEQYKVALELVENDEISPDEICECFLPFQERMNNRHK